MSLQVVFRVSLKRSVRVDCVTWVLWGGSGFRVLLLCF